MKSSLMIFISKIRMQDFLFQLLALLKVYQLLQSFGLASDCLKHVETIRVGKKLPSSLL